MRRRIFVRFTQENMSINKLLERLLIGADKDSYEKQFHTNVHKFFVNCRFEINYLEYLFLRLLHQGASLNKYEFSMYSYGDVSNFRFQFDYLVKKMIDFSAYYTPDEKNINAKIGNIFLGDPENAQRIVKLIKTKFRFRNAFGGLVQYTKESNGKIDKEILMYMNAAFQIYNSKDHISPRSRDNYVMDFFDIQGQISCYYLSGISRSKYSAEKIQLGYFGIEDIYEITKNINENSYDILYIMTYNKNTHASNINLLRQLFISSDKTGGICKIAHPDDSLELRPHKKCLFVILSEKDQMYYSKNFFDSVSYHKYTGIFINPKPEIEGKMY